jgi:hypothetical protein
MARQCLLQKKRIITRSENLSELTISMTVFLVTLNCKGVPIFRWRSLPPYLGLRRSKDAGQLLLHLHL